MMIMAANDRCCWSQSIITGMFSSPTRSSFAKGFTRLLLVLATAGFAGEIGGALER